MELTAETAKSTENKQFKISANSAVKKEKFSYRYGAKVQLAT